MQVFTYALLLASASANVLIENCDNAVSAASEFGTAIKDGARARTWGGSDRYKKNYDDFLGKLDDFYNHFKNSDDSDFNSEFKDKYCDFENNIADTLDTLNHHGNSCGGFDTVWEWSKNIWDKWNDICQEFGKKGKCKDIDHVWPHHKHAWDCFDILSIGWNFKGHGCTFPPRHPWWRHSSCEASSTPIPTSRGPSTKSSASPTPSTGGEPKPTSEPQPSSSPSTEGKPAPSTAPKPSTSTTKTGDDRPISTWTGTGTTFRCHVNGAAATGANA